jgi:folate-binding protein YgfZ
MAHNPLERWHEQAEALFLPYGALTRLVDTYGALELEYAAIRRSAALMDLPQRGLVCIGGKDRRSFLNNLVTQQLKNLTPGTGTYGYMLTLQGRVALDFVALEHADNLLLDVDRRLIANLLVELEKRHFAEDVHIADVSDTYGRLLLLGPEAGALLQAHAAVAVATLSAEYCHTTGTLGATTFTVYRHDFTGSPGYELIVPQTALVEVWEYFTRLPGPPPHNFPLVRPIGWAALNTARIEAGCPVLGVDILETTLPMETGPWYARAVDPNKGCYLGQEVVARMHARQTVARLLVGLRMGDEKVPVAGTPIFDGAEPIGIITSSCLSPLLGAHAIALGYVKTPYAKPGRVLEVLAEGGRSKATVSELPLVKL